MALMICPDCGKEISDAAISCPNCGLPRPSYERQSRERRQAESAAHEEHLQGIRNLYIAAAVLGLGATGLLAALLFSPWSRATLAAKGWEFLVAAALAGIGYLLFQQARRKQSPHT